MDKEELKAVLDLNRISVFKGEDYLQDAAGNNLQIITPIELKLLERIKNLENRIAVLEARKSITEVI